MHDRLVANVAAQPGIPVHLGDHLRHQIIHRAGEGFGAVGRGHCGRGKGVEQAAKGRVQTEIHAQHTDGFALAVADGDGRGLQQGALPGAGEIAAPLAAGGTVQLVERKIGDRRSLLAAGNVAVGNLDDGGVQAVKGVQHHLAARAKQGGQRRHRRLKAGDQMALFIGQCAGVAQGSYLGHGVIRSTLGKDIQSGLK